MVKIIFLLLIWGIPILSIEPSFHPKLLVVKENGKIFKGIQIGIEKRIPLSDINIYLIPEWKQFSNKSWMGSGLLSLEFPIWTLNAGYDVSNMSTTPLHQLHGGVDLKGKLLEFGMRHSEPWPVSKKVDGYKITAYRHTDCDFRIKSDHIHFGMGLFYSKKNIGYKTSLTTFIKMFESSIDWKYNKRMKNCFTVSIGWNFPSSSKKPVGGNSYFHYKKEKVKNLAPSFFSPTSNYEEKSPEAPFIADIPYSMNNSNERVHSWYDFFFRSK